jgi:hypothetical protein
MYEQIDQTTKAEQSSNNKQPTSRTNKIVKITAFHLRATVTAMYQTENYGCQLSIAFVKCVTDK